MPIIEDGGWRVRLAERALHEPQFGHRRTKTAARHWGPPGHLISQLEGILLSQGGVAVNNRRGKHRPDRVGPECDGDLSGADASLG